ncbi:LEAF RUST 10 DISEASE-RESISTANCE LOCUS RECEPTOR-LIKE PROTEIN KINASE-like 2.1 [Quercus robur]|uniref:LEAF RUST 10 DISEASE-RESISTANCE LOCUS RECEPTOR-LIKE PROTEIN KINASE-like 2.1 n=1 Tax=Quercus robur TaxID=38942 RepID=UPI002162239B|nr:LEAF RUST 10 DISEASE-RESISTANCE LOCUS RECEPTOR-LIKE PROTEIN KINASE-like 2.1 [Quercus robur]
MLVADVMVEQAYVYLTRMENSSVPLQRKLPRKKHSDKDTLFSLVSAEFDLQVYVSDACSSCYGRGGLCELEQNGKFHCAIADKVTITLFIGIGALMVIVCYFWRKFSSIKIINFWKKKNLTHKSVEAFLRNHEPLVIRRYIYSNIKSMTKSFNNKLGQRGYGCVYKGQLQDGCFMAVKVLEESKGNGEEFINEVASISRTSHVNIVTLKGFCSEGSKRALIYELMPNGSLENYGMMVLEMVGGRKNVDVTVNFSSEIYFPHWIYKHLELNEELGLLRLLKEGDEDYARKMIIVSLWCIQIDPSNRPSMSRVVEMLEGSLNSLQIPPKPFLFSPPRRSLTNSSIEMLSIQ